MGTRKSTGTETDEERHRYMIQVERSSGRLTIDQIRKILEETGVELDPDYGPIIVNPTLGRYDVRGWANSLSRQRAEKIQGVQFFSDPSIGVAR